MQGDVFATLQSDIDQSIDTVSVYTDGLYVGNAPQQQFGVTGRYQLNRTFDIGGQFVYNDKLFANYDPTRNETIDDKIQPYQLDPYGLLDLRVGARFELLGLDSYTSSMFQRIRYILLKKEEITELVMDLRDGFPGWGRTFNASLKLNF